MSTVTFTVVNGAHGAYRIEDRGINESKYEIVLTPGPEPFKVVAMALANGGPRGLQNVTVQVKAGGPTVVFSLEKQEVCYKWDERKKDWVLGDNTALFGSHRGTLNNVVKDMMDAAPLSTTRNTTLINYVTDSLFFECDLCGDEEEHEKFCKAMEEAAELVKAYNTHPAGPKIRHLTLSFCTDMTYVSDVLDMFRSIPFLEDVALMGHKHVGLPRLDGEGPHSVERDEQELKGELDLLSEYPFKARLYNSNGYEVLEDAPDFDFY